MWLTQCESKRTIVHHKAFRKGRIIRGQLSPKRFVAFSQCVSPFDQHLSHHLVHETDRLFCWRIFRINRCCGQHAFGATPEHREAIPLGIERNVRQHPVETVWHSFLISRCWDHPRGRALKYKQLSRLFCHLRNELTCTSTCSDHRNFFASEINIEIPSSRMERITLERINASDIGIIRSIQLPNSRHQNVRAVDTLGSGSVDRGHHPLLRVFIPNSRFNFGLEVDDG